MKAKDCIKMLDKIKETIIKISLLTIILFLTSLTLAVLKNFIIMLMDFQLRYVTSLLIICFSLSLLSLYVKVKYTPYRTTPKNLIRKDYNYVERVKTDDKFYYITNEKFNGNLYISSVLFLLFIAILNTSSIIYSILELYQHQTEITQTIVYEITIFLIAILILTSIPIMFILIHTFKVDKNGLKAYHKYSKEK